MTDRRLYTVSIPEHAQTQGEDSDSRNVGDLAAVAGGSGSVTPLGTDAKQRTLSVQYKGYNDDVMAMMLQELASSDDLETVPYFGVNPDGEHVHTERDGYYTVESADHSTPDDRVSDFPTVKMTVKRTGTQKTHWRYLTTKPVVVDNPYGNSQAQQVGIPGSARKVQWYDRDTNSTHAVPDRTAATKYGDVNIYRAEDCPYTRMALVYEVPYPDEGKTDVAVYDTRGHDSKTDTLEGQTVMEWQRVFSTDHEYEGEMVVSNGRRRLFINDETNNLAYEEWTPPGDGYGNSYGQAYGLGDSAGGWENIVLGTQSGTYYVTDVDLTTIDYSRVAGRLTFSDPDDDSVSSFVMAFVLARGAGGFVYYEPEDLAGAQGVRHGDIDEQLEPSASDRTYAMGENQTVRKRSEVRN